MFLGGSRVGKKSSKVFEIIFYMLFVSLIILLFYRFTVQNSIRIQEQNKVYAADSARQIAEQIDDQITNASELIHTYTFFLEKAIDKPDVPTFLLAQLEKNSPFDGITFTNTEGINFSPDGQTLNSRDREYYIQGMQGKSGITTIMDYHTLLR